MKTRPIEVVVVNQNGWWSAICKELQISGFGESEQDAIIAFQRALISNVTARLKASDIIAPILDEKASPPRETGRVVRRIPLNEPTRFREFAAA